MRSKFDYFNGGHPAGFFRYIFSALCIGLIALGTAQESVPSGVLMQGRVSGQDEEGNSVGVIANATVEILSEGGSPVGTAKTDETGFYEIAGLQSGNFTYHVSADGYTSDDVGRGFNIPNQGKGFIFDFILTQGDLTPPATSSLSGHVWVEESVDSGRKPGLGAQVVVSRTAGAMVVKRSVDEEGAYHFDLPVGEWKMSAILPGRAPQVNPEIVKTDPKTPATVDFIFMGAAKVAPPAPTEVHLLTSVPVAGKSEGTPSIVFVNRENGEMTAAKVSPATEAQLLAGGLAPDQSTNSLIWFYAEPADTLPEGRFYAEANLEEYATARSAERKVVGGEAIWFDVAFVPVKKVNEIDLTDQGPPATPEIASVSGRVSGVSETGDYLGVVEGAKVEFLDESGKVATTVMTNETGFYEVDSLGAGKWTYRVTAANYAAEDAGRGFELSESAGAQIFDFNLFQTIAEPPSSGVVSGTVSRVKGDGTEPLPGTKISLRQTSGGSVTSVTTGADGSYQVDVIAADWKLSALTNEFKLSVFPSTVSVTAGNNSTADFTFPEYIVPDLTLNKSVLALVSVAMDANGNAAMPSVDFVSEGGQTSIAGSVAPIPDTELMKMGIKRVAGANQWNWYEAKPDQALPTGNYTARGKLTGYSPGTSVSQEVGESLSVTFDLALSPIKSPDDDPIPLPPVNDLPDVPIKITGDPDRPDLPDRPDMPDDPIPLPPVNDLPDVPITDTDIPDRPDMPDRPPVPVNLPKVQVNVVDVEGVPIPGVDIRLVDKTRGKTSDEAVMTLSNGQGFGSFKLTDGFGEYDVMASLVGFDGAGENIKVTQAVHSVSLVLYKEGVPRLVDLTGVVVERTPGQEDMLLSSNPGTGPSATQGQASGHPDGRKVANALITFKSAAGTTLPESLSGSLRTDGNEAFSDENGAFSAKGITEGIYEVAILAEGYMEFSESVEVDRDMGPLLFALDPRNMARDNWIKMILTEGWGNSETSRTYHGKGLEAGGQDSNLDYALGLACLPSKDDNTAIRGFTDAVGKVSQELWWDRACEGYIWTLMRYEKADTASGEIRRLVSTYYNAREASNEAQATANMMGVAVGMLIGPWSTETSASAYVKLDLDVLAMLKGPLRVAYLEGRDSVKNEFTKLTQAEQDAAKDMADKSAAEKNRMIAGLEKEMQGLNAQKAEAERTIKDNNQEFEAYKNNAIDKATKLTAEITKSEKERADINVTYAKRIEEMRGESEARLRVRLEEIRVKFTAKTAEVERIMAANKGMENNESALAGWLAAIQNAKAKLAATRAEIAALKIQEEQAISDARRQGKMDQQAQQRRLVEINQAIRDKGVEILDMADRIEKYKNTAFVDFQNELARLRAQIIATEAQLPAARASDQQGANNMNGARNAESQRAQQALRGLNAELAALEANYQNLSQRMGGNDNRLTQIDTRMDAIENELGVLGDTSVVCEECKRYSERPPNCEFCAELERINVAKIFKLNREWEGLDAQGEQISNAMAAGDANNAGAAANYQREKDRLNQAIRYQQSLINNPGPGPGGGQQMGGEVARVQQIANALRQQFATVSSNMDVFANGEFAQNLAGAEQNKQMLEQEGRDLQNQYNAISGQMNNQPGVNMQFGARLEALYATQNEWQAYLVKVETGLRDNQNKKTSGNRAANEQLLITLRQDLATLTADFKLTSEKITQNSNWQPSEEEKLSDAKMADLFRRATALQAEIEDLEASLLDVQTKFAQENVKHTKTIDDLNGIVVGLTNKLNEIGARLAGLPDPVGEPVEGGADFSQLKKSILSYRSYPVEQRRDELLNWVTRGSMSLR